MYENEIKVLELLRPNTGGINDKALDTAIALMRAADRKCPTCNHDKNAHPDWCHTEVK
jgi:hypothetical protein